jgi:hypothetical protein
MPKPPRGSLRPWQNVAGAALLLLAAVALAGCSGLASTSEETPVTGPDPASNKVVANYLNATFKDRALYNAFEISDSRWVHTVKGWNWITCIRFQDHGHPRIYAIFIKANAIIDARYAVQTDGCDTPNYTSFDLMAAASSGASPGALEPLH